MFCKVVDVESCPASRKQIKSIFFRKNALHSFCTINFFHLAISTANHFDVFPLTLISLTFALIYRAKHKLSLSEYLMALYFPWSIKGGTTKEEKRNNSE